MAFTMEKNIHLRAGLSLCLLLHRSTSLCSSGFGSQQAIFSLAGVFLQAGDKHLAIPNSEILHREEKAYTATSQIMFLYTGVLRAMGLVGDYIKPFRIIYIKTFRIKCLR